jgi:hypothetical protein
MKTEVNETKPVNEETLKEFLFLISKEEAERIKFGKVFIELTVHNSKITNLQAETRRSVNINQE